MENDRNDPYDFDPEKVKEFMITKENRDATNDVRDFARTLVGAALVYKILQRAIEDVKNDLINDEACESSTSPQHRGPA